MSCEITELAVRYLIKLWDSLTRYGITVWAVKINEWAVGYLIKLLDVWLGLKKISEWAV